VHITFQGIGPDEGIEAVSGIAGVAKAKPAPEGRFIVEARSGADIRPDLFHLAVARNWVILEMRTEQISLEDVFRKLTMN